MDLPENLQCLKDSLNIIKYNPFNPPGLNPGQPPHGQPYFSPHPGQQVYSQPGQVIRMMVPAGMPGGAMMPGMVPVMTSHSGETPGGHQHSVSGSQGHHQQMWGGNPSPHPPHLATATPPTQVTLSLLNLTDDMTYHCDEILSRSCYPYCLPQ